MSLEDKDELELTKKLLTTFHLSALERKNLPEGKVRLSIILMVIKQILNSEHYFPVKWRPDMPFAGGLIEKLPNNKIKLYHKAEKSLSNYQIIEEIEFNSLDQAVIKFLKITFGEQIDGIQLNY